MADEQIEMNYVHPTGWRVSVSKCGAYLYASLDGAPGYVQLKADDEGFVADIIDEDSQSVATTYAMYSELEPE